MMWTVYWIGVIVTAVALTAGAIMSSAEAYDSLAAFLSRTAVTSAGWPVLLVILVYSAVRGALENKKRPRRTS